MAASWHTSALVSNLPEGSLVRSRSVLNSLWNCSCVPWSAYSAMTFWASRLEGWRRRPALEFDPRQDQVLPARADRALDQSQHAARSTRRTVRSTPSLAMPMLSIAKVSMSSGSHLHGSTP